MLGDWLALGDAPGALSLREHGDHGAAQGVELAGKRALELMPRVFCAGRHARIDESAIASACSRCAKRLPTEVSPSMRAAAGASCRSTS